MTNAEINSKMNESQIWDLPTEEITEEHIDRLYKLAEIRINARIAAFEKDWSESGEGWKIGGSDWEINIESIKEEERAQIEELERCGNPRI